jgi:hypothetical protein
MDAALTFGITTKAEILVTTKRVVYRWCDDEGRIHCQDIGRTSIGRLLAKQLDAQKVPRCAGDGTAYPYGFYSWTNGQRLNWLHEHRETLTTDALVQQI